MSASPVLVAEPDPLQRQLLDMLLGVDAFELTMVASGDDALAHLRSHTPAAVVLASDLGDVSGLVVCRKLKSVRRLAHVPVVILTPEPDAGSTMSDTLRREVREAGASLAIQKPLGDKNLRERLVRLMQEPPSTAPTEPLYDTTVLDDLVPADAGGLRGGVPSGMATELGGLRAEVARLRQENESLKARLSKLKERAKVLQSEIDDLKKPRGLFGRRG